MPAIENSFEGYCLPGLKFFFAKIFTVLGSVHYRRLFEEEAVVAMFEALPAKVAIGDSLKVELLFAVINNLFALTRTKNNQDVLETLKILLYLYFCFKSSEIQPSAFRIERFLKGSSCKYNLQEMLESAFEAVCQSIFQYAVMASETENTTCEKVLDMEILPSYESQGAMTELYHCLEAAYKIPSTKHHVSRMNFDLGFFLPKIHESITTEQIKIDYPQEVQIDINIPEASPGLVLNLTLEEWQNLTFTDLKTLLLKHAIIDEAMMFFEGNIFKEKFYKNFVTSDCSGIIQDSDLISDWFFSARLELHTIPIRTLSRHVLAADHIVYDRSRYIVGGREDGFSEALFRGDAPENRRRKALVDSHEDINAALNNGKPKLPIQGQFVRLYIANFDNERIDLRGRSLTKNRKSFNRVSLTDKEQDSYCEYLIEQIRNLVNAKFPHDLPAFLELSFKHVRSEFSDSIAWSFISQTFKSISLIDLFPEEDLARSYEYTLLASNLFPAIARGGYRVRDKRNPASFENIVVPNQEEVPKYCDYTLEFKDSNARIITGTDIDKYMAYPKRFLWELKQHNDD